MLLLLILSVLFGEVGNSAVTEDIINCLYTLRRLLSGWLLLLLIWLLIWITSKNVKQIVCSRTLILIIRMEAWDWSTVLVIATLIFCLVLVILIGCDLLRPTIIKVERFHICPIIIVVAVVWLIVVILIRLVIALVVLVLAAAISVACQRIVVSFLVVLVVWILWLIWSSSIWVVVDGLNLLSGR